MGLPRPRRVPASHTPLAAMLPTTTEGYKGDKARRWQVACSSVTKKQAAVVVACLVAVYMVLAMMSGSAADVPGERRGASSAAIGSVPSPEGEQQGLVGDSRGPEGADAVLKPDGGLPPSPQAPPVAGGVAGAEIEPPQPPAQIEGGEHMPFQKKVVLEDPAPTPSAPPSKLTASLSEGKGTSHPGQGSAGEQASTSSALPPPSLTGKAKGSSEEEPQVAMPPSLETQRPRSGHDEAKPEAPPPKPAATHSSRLGSLPKLPADKAKQAAVRDMFKHAWQGYRDFAWGKDALRPVSKSADDNFLGMGATAVDAMDTLLIMGLVEEYEAAEDWVLHNLHFTAQRGVSVFETTIRVLGGLLSAYDLTDTLQSYFKVDAPLSTHRKALLERAAECADALKFAFDTATGIPYGTVSLGPGRRAYNPSWAGRASSTAEAMTLQLEWEYLAKATGRQEYATLVRRTMAAFHKADPEDHLLRTRIDPSTGRWANQEIKLGANGDSAFEYLVKQWVWSGGWRRDAARQPWTGSLQDMPNGQAAEERAWDGALRGGARAPAKEPTPAGPINQQVASQVEGDYFDAVRSLYDKTVHGIKSHLVHLTDAPMHDPPLAFISERQGQRISHKMDHLVCFAGGMLALGAESAWGAAPKPGWDRAAYEGLHQQAAGGESGASGAPPSREELLALQDEDDMRLAAELTRTCHEMYTFTASGLAPEIVKFTGGEGGLRMIVDPGAKHCLLRPEAVESFYVMYRLTGDEKYRDWGWDVVQAIEKHARIESGGYSSIRDVTHIPVQYRDHQESFFLAETLKYLYLLFSDSDLIPLDKYVFNTEAHPLSILGSAAPA